MKRTLHLPLFLAACLTACGEGVGGGAGPAISETTSKQLRPAEPALAEIYGRSCRSCHTIAATGAPLTGDAEAWRVRMEKGMPVLVDNVVNGFGGMPPFGMCMECDGDQFEALIRRRRASDDGAGP